MVHLACTEVGISISPDDAGSLSDLATSRIFTAANVCSMKNLLPFVASVLILMGWGVQAHAQLTEATDDGAVSYTEGLYGKPHYGGYGHAVEQYQVGFGQGIGLNVRYTFTSLFSISTGFDITVMQVVSHEDDAIQELLELTRYIYRLGVVDLGGQLNFRVGPSELIPYGTAP